MENIYSLRIYDLELMRFTSPWRKEAWRVWWPKLFRLIKMLSSLYGNRSKSPSRHYLSGADYKWNVAQSLAVYRK